MTSPPLIPSFVRRARRRIHRTFTAWYEENGARFRHRLVFTRRTDGCLHFQFEGINEAVQGILNDGGIVASVHWQGECLDLIWCGDVSPEAGPAGIHCRCCEPEGREVYPTREALWIAHEFEPFLEWVNGTVAEARWLGMWIVPDHFSSAGVFRTPADVEKEFGDGAFSIPLQTGSGGTS